MNTRMLVTAALVAAAPLSAQQAPAGMMSWSITGKVPAAVSSQAPMPIEKLPKMLVEVGSDGRQMATHITITGEDLAGGMEAVAGMKVMMVWRTGSDSAHIGVAVPATIRPFIGQLLPNAANAPGVRLAMKIPNLDSIAKGMPFNPDSVKMDAMPTVTNLGTKSTVGGMSCENWQVIGRDSGATKADTISMCMVEQKDAPLDLASWFADRLDLDEAVEKAGVAKLFGGRKLFPVRVAMGDAMVMEMVAGSRTAPPAAFFTIPADFAVMDPSMLPIPGMDGN